MREFRLEYARHNVPEHTREGIENYLFHGYTPGSFLTCVLSNDLWGSCVSADHINRDALVNIVCWMQHNMPPGSWGSRETMDRWLKDANNCRTNFVTEWEKKTMWEILKDE
jgi:hypothetical protein